MGGNALNHTSVRLTKKNYDRVAMDCVAKINSFYPDKRVAALGSYRTKSSFGDCDILVEAGDHYNPFDLAVALGAIEVVRNGPVTSIGLLVRPELNVVDGNVFQVDLIKMEPEGFDFAVNYFGQGDAGNLLGRLFHAVGTTLRHDGLVYYMRDGDYKFREIILTRNFEDALSFMGYDPEIYSAGFDTAEDIYQYVASSQFFNADIFLLENRNAISRTRDRKRKMYMEFLKFCDDRKELPQYSFPENKSAWFSRINEYFPNFMAEYNQAVEDLSRIRAAKSKFNGQWVSQLTGLEGKELGGLMKKFKESFDSEEARQAFVLEKSQEEIGERIKSLRNSMLPRPLV